MTVVSVNAKHAYEMRKRMTLQLGAKAASKGERIANLYIVWREREIELGAFLS